MCFHTYISEGPEVDFSQLAAGSKTSGAPKIGNLRVQRLERPTVVFLLECCLFTYTFICIYVFIFI